MKQPKFSYWDYEDKWYESVNDIFPELLNNELIHVQSASLYGMDNFLSRSHDVLLSEITDAYNNGKRIFVYECLREALVIQVVTKLNTIITKANLPDMKFIWLTGDPMGEKAANEKMPNKRFQVLGAFYFEYLAQNIFPKYTKEYQVGPKEKTFLCLNNTIRQSRIDLFECMLQYDLVKDSYYSFIGNSRGTLGIDELIDKLRLSGKYPNIVNNKNILPLLLTDELPNKELCTPDLLVEDTKYYENSYFSVVTETVFYAAFRSPPPNIGQLETVNGLLISEKTYKSIAMKHPFILLTRPHTLKLLRERGYKTFSPFIDESYDEIENDVLRLQTVANEIHRLSKIDLIEFTHQVKDIVEHNAQHLWSQTIFDPNKIKT